MSIIPDLLAQRWNDDPLDFLYWTAQGRYAWTAMSAVILVYVFGPRRNMREPLLFFVAVLSATAILVVVTAAVLRIFPGTASLTAALFFGLAYALPAAFLYFLAKRVPRALPVAFALALALAAADAMIRLSYANKPWHFQSVFVVFSRALRHNDFEVARQCVGDGLDPALPMVKLGGAWIHHVVKHSPNPAPALEFLLEYDIPVNQPDDNGATPLALAMARGDAASAALLLAHGAVPDGGDGRAAPPGDAAGEPSSDASAGASADQDGPRP